MANEPKLIRIEFDVCELCLTGAGGECHAPGCTFWMKDAPIGSAIAWLRERRVRAVDGAGVDLLGALEASLVEAKAGGQPTAEPPIMIPCEGSGSTVHDVGVSKDDAGVPEGGMCPTCGQVVQAVDWRATPHDRKDIIAMINRGDFDG